MADLLPVGRLLRKAFSLVEVLGVVTVAGILAALLLPAVQKARLSAASANSKASPRPANSSGSATFSSAVMVGMR